MKAKPSLNYIRTSLIVWPRGGLKAVIALCSRREKIARHELPCHKQKNNPTERNHPGDLYSYSFAYEIETCSTLAV
jgi:hypothetical protein